MLNDLEKVTRQAVEGEVRLMRQRAKDAYDELEGISAKVKVWIKVNKVRLFIDAGILLAGIIIGAIL